MPAQGGFVERRVGVLDRDPGTVRFACNDKTLYVAFRTEVDKTARLDLGQMVPQRRIQERRPQPGQRRGCG